MSDLDQSNIILEALEERELDREKAPARTDHTDAGDETGPPFLEETQDEVDDLPPYRWASQAKSVSENEILAGAGERTKEDSLRSSLADRRFDFAVQPPRPHPTLKLGDKVISTPGNLTNIQAPAKAGKSAVIGAIIAAILNGNRQGPDTLGFSAENPEGKALIHLDTEQSRYDHDALVRRSLRRAMLNSPPEWLRSYSLTDLTIDERVKALDLILRDASDECGGVFMAIIDGIADLCVDPNDPTESFSLIGRLHSTAITYDCAILTVLHENPGSESGKMRGHLGSQLERKAETPLRLAKNAATGVTTIWADRARHCHIPNEQGMCFAWSDEAGMHVSLGSASTIKASAKHAKYRDEAEAAFGDSESLGYSKLVAAIMEATGLKVDAAKKRVSAYHAEGIIAKWIDGTEHGTYHLEPASSASV